MTLKYVKRCTCVMQISFGLGFSLFARYSSNCLGVTTSPTHSALISSSWRPYALAHSRKLSEKYPPFSIKARSFNSGSQRLVTMQSQPNEPPPDKMNDWTTSLPLIILVNRSRASPNSLMNDGAT